ncbi:M48 family metallopeptidase [Pseudoalteromonas piscicida]|uniref:Peptidase M48 n=1 Tax=Pseudoalteromonas piscicida TaxID=43662 RepID=A0A2A5JUB4_PSEO7|nr:M48 family metallopeptidase [Pseudoalteromonas piscicida]PCK33072.1 peptidase M48 [Pseudoalteromonas piscicida]
MSSKIHSKIRQSKQTQWLWIIAATVVVVLFSGYQFYTKGVPFLAEEISASLPKQIYQVIDEGSLDELDNSEFSESNLSEIKQQEIRALFVSLLGADTHAERDFKLEFRQWKDRPNAMALTNGTIVITDSMVKLATTQPELSAVLLHEIGHVEHNHVMESLVSSSIVFVSLSVVLGDISALSDIMMQGAILGINQSYSQQAELEADRYAHQALTKLYGNGSAMVTIFEKLASETDEPHSWLSSHPSFEQRIEKIKQSP